MAKKSDAKLFQELNIPFESPDSANNNLQAFFDDVYELRKKHAIPNVAIVARVEIRESGPAMASAFMGDEILEESVAAWYFGRASSSRQELIRNAVERGSEASIRGIQNRR